MEIRLFSNAPLTQLTELMREAMAEKQREGGSVAAKLAEAVKAELQATIKSTNRIDVRV